MCGSPPQGVNVLPENEFGVRDNGEEERAAEEIPPVVGNEARQDVDEGREAEQRHHEIPTVGPPHLKMLLDEDYFRFRLRLLLLVLLFVDVLHEGACIDHRHKGHGSRDDPRQTDGQGREESGL